MVNDSIDSARILTDYCRSKMDVVFMVDTNITTNLSHRKRVLEDVEQVCANLNANLHHITVSIG